MFVNFRQPLLLKCCYFVTEFSKLVFQHITASICGGMYARLYCILYCVYDVIVEKTTESDRQSNLTTNPNPKRYLVAVQHGGLASS